jgi:hypothetical protein
MVSLLWHLCGATGFLSVAGAISSPLQRRGKTPANFGPLHNCATDRSELDQSVEEFLLDFIDTAHLHTTGSLAL